MTVGGKLEAPVLSSGVECAAVYIYMSFGDLSIN